MRALGSYYGIGFSALTRRGRTVAGALSPSGPTPSGPTPVSEPTPSGPTGPTGPETPLAPEEPVKKASLIPLIGIGSVLLIGGAIVTAYILKKRRRHA